MLLYYASLLWSQTLNRKIGLVLCARSEQFTHPFGFTRPCCDNGFTIFMVRGHTVTTADTVVVLSYSHNVFSLFAF